MTANQIFRDVRWPNAASRIGFIGACLALSSACSGSIEETEVDRGHLEQGNTGVPHTAALTASNTPPARAPAATPPAAAPPAAAPPAAAPPAATLPEPEPAEEEDPPPAASGDISFAADVWPIFKTGCTGCHTTSNLGGQNIGNPDEAKALADSKREKDLIVTRVSTGNMPPGCGKPPGGGGNCLTQDDFDTIKDWIAAGTPP